MDHAKPDHPHQIPESDVKAPNILERAKEEIEAIMHSKNGQHQETHRSIFDINENTPIDKVKAPNIFERAKEEVEALVETIHPKKDPDHGASSKTEGGFWAFLGRRLEKFCSPWDRKRR